MFCLLKRLPIRWTASENTSLWAYLSRGLHRSLAHREYHVSPLSSLSSSRKQNKSRPHKQWRTNQCGDRNRTTILRKTHKRQSSARQPSWLCINKKRSLRVSCYWCWNQWCCWGEPKSVNNQLPIVNSLVSWLANDLVYFHLSATALYHVLLEILVSSVVYVNKTMFVWFFYFARRFSMYKQVWNCKKCQYKDCIKPALCTTTIYWIFLSIAVEFFCKIFIQRVNNFGFTSKVSNLFVWYQTVDGEDSFIHIDIIVRELIG